MFGLVLWVTYLNKVLRFVLLCVVDYSNQGMNDWFAMSCMTTHNFCFYLQNRLFQTSQTGGQWYSDTSSFSIPCFESLTSFFAWSLIKCLILNLKNIWKAKIDPVTASFLQKNDKNNFVSFFWSVSLNAIWMKHCLMSI